MEQAGEPAGGRAGLAGRQRSPSASAATSPGVPQATAAARNAWYMAPTWAEPGRRGRQQTAE